MNESTRKGPSRHFASDNYAPVCPEVWAALGEVNAGHAVSYGDDPWTAEAAALLQRTFAADCAVYFIFNGTAANALALAALCGPHHAVLCHEHAHIQTDECGAPEFFTGGAKLLPLSGPQAKLAPASLREAVTRGHGIHTSKPRAVSLTQATELGTVYSLPELRALRDEARALGLRVHLDGARLANALVTLGATPAEIVAASGADVLCLGGTKNGGLGCEALLFFDRNLAQEFDYRRKQAGQLASKMRYLAAQWLGLLRDGAWLRHAAHSNARAAQLEAALRETPGVKVLYPREANAVFVRLSPAVAETLHAQGWRFYNFLGPDDYRLMCAWDTQEDDVSAFANDLRKATDRHGG